MNRVLVVDDEPDPLHDLLSGLRAGGYSVDTAATGAAALESASREFPDAVILSLDLPDIGGPDIIRGLRAWSRVPVIALSTSAGAEDKILALDAGADDHVTKPFTTEELLARLRAVMRRPAGEQTDAWMRRPDLLARAVIGDHVIDLDACTVRHVRGPDATDRAVRLTPTEWSVLTLLLRSPGILVTGRRILTEIWGPDHEDRSNYLRVYVSTLRRKLERDPARPRHLITEPGVGYRFEP